MQKDLEVAVAEQIDRMAGIGWSRQRRVPVVVVVVAGVADNVAEHQFGRRHLHTEAFASEPGSDNTEPALVAEYRKEQELVERFLECSELTADSRLAVVDWQASRRVTAVPAAEVGLPEQTR